MSTNPSANGNGFKSPLPERYATAARRRLASLFGDELNDLLSSLDATERVLLDSDPTRRHGALRLIAENWKPNPTSEQLYRQIALTDPHPDVRVEALRCWSRLRLPGSRDVAFSKALAFMAKNESETPMFRCTAYFALCNIQNLSVPAKLRIWKSLVYDKSHMPEGLDWNIVDMFADIKESP